MEELRDRISSLGGDRGKSETDEATLGGGRRRKFAWVSGSSGIVSLDSGRVALPELLVEVGDCMILEVTSLDVEVAEVRAFGGLIGVIREAVVVGRFGGADAAAPRVVRLVLSVLGSGFDVREVAAPTVGVLAGRLFSSPSAVAPSAAPFPIGFLVEEVTGRVGGLLMVLPPVRVDSALVRDVVGDAVALAAVPGLVELVVAFFGSSVGSFAGGFAPGVVRLSILLLPGSRHRYSRQC